jgi:hypothetical protein
VSAKLQRAIEDILIINLQHPTKPMTPALGIQAGKDCSHEKS